MTQNSYTSAFHTILLILVALIWGSTFFIIKDTLQNTNEYMIVFTRTLIAALIMVFVVAIKNYKNLFNINYILKGIFLGFLLVSTYLPQTIGLKYTSSGHSAFITGAAVAIVPVLLFLYFRKNINWYVAVTVAIIIIGLFLLTYDLKTRINKGDLYTMITMFAYANHIVFAGRFVKKENALTLIAYQFLAASLFSISGVFFTEATFSVGPPSSWYAIVYLAIFGTLFCYFVSVWIQQYVSSIKVAITFSLEPVFAAFFGYYFLAETLNIAETAGAILILSGLIIYQVFEYRLKRSSNQE